jgi:LCP family protein required for cell wall assembly
VRGALAAARTVLRMLPVLLLLVFFVPGSGVRPATLTLTKVERAEGYDAGAEVVWVLVLGADPVEDTDAMQLLGIDTRTGAAAAIGIPRDTYVDLGGGEKGKINGAFHDGGPDLAAQLVDELVGIPPDYVLVTRGDGFVSMVEALGGVTVDSPLDFTSKDGTVHFEKGLNELDGEEALQFAVTRRFPGVVSTPDFTRSRNHQALLLGLLKGLQDQDDGKGFLESMALSSLDGIDTDDASPLDLYRLLNALTGVDPAKAKGCILVGTEGEDAAGNQFILPDHHLALRLGSEAKDDATFESGCEPGQ